MAFVACISFLVSCFTCSPTLPVFLYGTVVLANAILQLLFRQHLFATTNCGISSSILFGVLGWALVEKTLQYPPLLAPLYWRRGAHCHVAKSGLGALIYGLAVLPAVLFFRGDDTENVLSVGDTVAKFLCAGVSIVGLIASFVLLGVWSCLFYYIASTERIRWQHTKSIRTLIFYLAAFLNLILWTHGVTEWALGKQGYEISKSVAVARDSDILIVISVAIVNFTVLLLLRCTAFRAKKISVITRHYFFDCALEYAAAEEEKPEKREKKDSPPEISSELQIVISPSSPSNSGGGVGDDSNGAVPRKFEQFNEISLPPRTKDPYLKARVESSSERSKRYSGTNQQAPSFITSDDVVLKKPTATLPLLFSSASSAPATALSHPSVSPSTTAPSSYPSLSSSAAAASSSSPIHCKKKDPDSTLPSTQCSSSELLVTNAILTSKPAIGGAPKNVPLSKLVKFPNALVKKTPGSSSVYRRGTPESREDENEPIMLVPPPEYK